MPIFGHTYTFVVYQEYLNGWGLPLHAVGSSQQLSVEELISGPGVNAYLPEDLLFHPLENKKPVLIFHKEKVLEDHLDAQNKPVKYPVSQKESLNEIVIRSDGADDSDQVRRQRHLLPERISMEHALWYDLLAPEQMTGQESFNWKRRYLCSFNREKDYDEYLEKNVKGCPEGCSRYCGGTAMEAYYPDPRISPRHLSDPGIEGVKAVLFWDKESIAANLDALLAKPDSDIRGLVVHDIKEITFGGTLGLRPLSCLMDVGGAADETFMRKDAADQVGIFLKKGAQIYVALVNKLHKDFLPHLETTWYMPMRGYAETHGRGILSKAESIKYRQGLSAGCLRNPPRILALTHAVKEPLVVPQILEFYTPNQLGRRYAHVEEWLEKLYTQGPYEIRKNIITERVHQKIEVPIQGSGQANVRLVAHFERLDTIGKIEFLRELAPTGTLELWMRKREFVDDPSHDAADPALPNYNPEINHRPDVPVRDFDSHNPFRMERKIDFTPDVMQQLKSLSHVSNKEDVEDLFRAIISRLELEYDFKSVRFEEREYYLKNASKFIGYFTDEKMLDATGNPALDKLEEYVLPKRTEVLNNPALRFSVMLLNDQQPKQPEPAFAITTIQEDRNISGSGKQTSTQRGNIVTIYFKRGVFSSGGGEKIGLIVNSDGHYNSIYEAEGYLSKAGRDIVSDKHAPVSQYLQVDDVVIPKVGAYQEGYDADLGLCYYTPKFDFGKQLWKIEVELDVRTAAGRQMHNPFVNLSFVTFQPFSNNYNDGKVLTLEDLYKDCRISAPINITWCYLLPERRLSVSFSGATEYGYHGEVDLTIAFDHESLHHHQVKDGSWVTRSNFIVTVEGQDEGGFIWTPVPSCDMQPKCVWQLHHPLLTTEILSGEKNIVSRKLRYKAHIGGKEFSRFRVRLVEVEWFDETKLDCLKTDEAAEDFLDKENMRVRYIELAYSGHHHTPHNTMQ